MFKKTFLVRMLICFFAMHVFLLVGTTFSIARTIDDEDLSILLDEQNHLRIVHFKNTGKSYLNGVPGKMSLSDFSAFLKKTYSGNKELAGVSSAKGQGLKDKFFLRAIIKILKEGGFKRVILYNLVNEPNAPPEIIAEY